MVFKHQTAALRGGGILLPWGAFMRTLAPRRSFLPFFLLPTMSHLSTTPFRLFWLNPGIPAAQTQCHVIRDMQFGGFQP
jgi:hypothetical protein